MESSPFPEHSFYKKTSRKPRGFLILVFLLILILVVVFLGLSYGRSLPFIETIINKTGSQAEDSKKLSPSPTQSESSPTPVASSSPTLAPEEDIDRGSYTISVLNGSGESGAAKEVSDFLSDLGYEIGTIGNADAFDYTDVTIRVKADSESLLSLLKKDLSKQYNVDETLTTLPANSSADAVVIYGAE